MYYFPQLHLQCDMLLLHSFDIIDLKTRRVGDGVGRDIMWGGISCGEGGISCGVGRDIMWHCDAVACHTVVYPTYHDQKRLA